MKVLLLLIALVLFALWATWFFAKRQISSRFSRHLVGTWKLVSTEEKLRDGKTRPFPNLGSNASGFLIYTGDGHMCAALMAPSRQNWRDPEYATDAEKIAAGSGFVSYCGTYKIDEKNRIITHYPEVSFVPNFVGTAQKRPYRLEDERLIFSDTAPEGEVERWTIVWEKTRQ